MFALCLNTVENYSFVVSPKGIYKTTKESTQAFVNRNETMLMKRDKIDYNQFGYIVAYWEGDQLEILKPQLWNNIKI